MYAINAFIEQFYISFGGQVFGRKRFRCLAHLIVRHTSGDKSLVDF